jgi:hypothetical protein
MRVEPVENEIVLQLQESTGMFTSAGKLLNISELGALVLSDLRAPSTGRVFIQMRTPVRTDWTAARIVRRGTNNELGMEFLDACHWDLKLAATMGIDFKNLFCLTDSERFSHSGD